MTAIGNQSDGFAEGDAQEFGEPEMMELPGILFGEPEMMDLPGILCREPGMMDSPGILCREPGMMELPGVLHRNPENRRLFSPSGAKSPF